MTGPVHLDIDKDIRNASTLPAWFYRDESMHAWLVENVFARSWQLLTSIDQIKAPAQTMPMPFLSGCVEEPLVLTRDAQDRLHCLSNVCTHRGMLVANVLASVAQWEGAAIGAQLRACELGQLGNRGLTVRAREHERGERAQTVSLLALGVVDDDLRLDLLGEQSL